MSTLTTIATEAELFVNDFLSAFIDQQETSLNSAHLLTVRENNGEVTVEPVSSNVDVYELIDEAIAETPFTVRSSDVLAVLTTGWAAPLNPETGEVEGRPSEHSQRRRVRLMAFVRRSDLRMVSVLRFGDSDEVVIDEGSATGTLAEAMLSLGDAGK